jgi:hypothetical protein
VKKDKYIWAIGVENDERECGYFTSKSQALAAIGRMFHHKEETEWDASDLDKQKPFNNEECMVFVRHIASGKSVILVVRRHLANNGAMLFCGVVKRIDTYV